MKYSWDKLRLCIKPETEEDHVFLLLLSRMEARFSGSGHSDGKCIEVGVEFSACEQVSSCKPIPIKIHFPAPTQEAPQ